MGARTRRVGTTTGPIHQGVRRSVMSRQMVLAGLVDLARPAQLPFRAVLRAGGPAFPSRRAVLKDVILTPEGYDQLKRELEHLRVDRRREVAERIAHARAFGEIA